jgi:hypothetical protein
MLGITGTENIYIELIYVGFFYKITLLVGDGFSGQDRTWLVSTFLIY